MSSYPHHQDFSKSRVINNEKRNVTTLICDIINASKYPTETLALEKPSGKFYKSLLIGAGHLFTYGDFFKTIQLDEKLHHIFSGEEILIAIMAFTNGWDIYSPAYMNLFHYYNHKKPNWHKDVISKNNSRKDESESYKKLENILNSDINDSCLGNERSIAEFWKELGFYRDKTTIKDKFPSNSKTIRCDKTPTIDYPILESFSINKFEI